MTNINTIKLSQDIIKMLKIDKFKFNFVPKDWSEIVDTCSHHYYLEECVRKQNNSIEHLFRSNQYNEVVELINEWLLDTYKERKKDYFWNYPKQTVNPLEGILGEL